MEVAALAAERLQRAFEQNGIAVEAGVFRLYPDISPTDEAVVVLGSVTAQTAHTVARALELLAGQ